MPDKLEDSDNPIGTIEETNDDRRSCGLVLCGKNLVEAVYSFAESNRITKVAAVANVVIKYTLRRFQFEQILLGPRAEYFLVLYDSFSNNPWLGLGAGNFAIVGAAATGSDQVHSAHGLIWAALADYGIIGCIMLTSFLAVILYQLGKTIKALPKHASIRIVGVGIFASLIALYFQSLFVGDRIQFHLILLLALAAVLVNLHRSKKLHIDNQESKEDIMVTQ